MNIGEKLKKTRLHNNLTLKALSSRSGISPSYISDIENDRSLPSIDTLLLLCDALEIKAYTLFLKTPSPSSQEDTLYLEALLLLLEDLPTWDARDKEDLLGYLKEQRARRERDHT